MYERVREEVDEIPEREAVTPRGLPVDRCEAAVVDDDVPAACVVVLQDGGHGRKRIHDIGEVRVVPEREDLVAHARAFSVERGRGGTGGRPDVDQPRSDVVDQTSLRTGVASP